LIRSYRRKDGREGRRKMGEERRRRSGKGKEEGREERGVGERGLVKEGRRG
jgi:hypothetical protein